MTGGQLEVLAIGFLLIWLAVDTLWDLFRSLLRPVWLVLPPVLAGVAYQAAYGQWYIAAAMAAALLLHLSDRLPVRALGTILLIAAAIAAGNWALAAGFGLFWILWETNIAGGADALAAYAALMLVPSWEMFGFLLAGMFLWAVGVMAVVYRGQVIERARRMAFRIMMRDLPTDLELDKEGRPTIGGIWIGAALFAVWLAAF